MNKLSKRAIPTLILMIMVISILPVVPVKAAVSITNLYDTDYVLKPDGDYGDKLVVLGEGVTAGVDVNVYWDGVKAWDGEKGLMNSTEADPDGSFEVWLKVPEAKNGGHWIWVKDTDTGQTAVSPEFTVLAKIKMSPSSGLYGDKVTLKGYGFSVEKKITKITFEYPYAPQDLTTSPSTPETDELGSWSATFTVPHAEYGEFWEVYAEDETITVWAAEDFTIGAAISLDVEEGPVGTVVEIRGRGFDDAQTISGKVKLDGINCYVTDDDTVSAGRFEIEAVVPSVPDEGDYTITVTGTGHSASADFEVLGLAEIELDPSFAVQGESVAIHGYNFTQISGEEVSVELWDKDETGVIATVKTLETDGNGEFEGKFTVPARSSGVYTIVARQEAHDTTPDYNIHGSKGFRIGLMIVIPSPNSGPSGTVVTLTGTGFSEGKEWNATLGGLTIVEDGDVDTTSNLVIDNNIPTFFVPTMDPDTYDLLVLDIESEIIVETEFTVTQKTMVETDPLVAPNDYNVSIIGKYFSAKEGTDIEFVIYNVTADGEVDEDWDMDVLQGKPGSPAETDEDGNVTAWWEAPDSDTLSLGDYLINATDENELFAQYMFTLVTKTVDIDTRKPSFALGDTVYFDIESSFAKKSSYIEVFTPDGDMYWITDPFVADIWVKVGTVERVPYYEQTAGGNPLTLIDVPLGTWSWTWYDSKDKEIDSGTFTVTEAPADILAEQMRTLTEDFAGLTEDFSGLSEDVSTLSTNVAGLASDVAAAAAAAQEASAAVSDLADVVGNVAEMSNIAKTSADSAKESADRAADLAEDASNAATGLTTLVYGAIGASLVAALAAIVSLMQISRRIAG